MTYKKADVPLGTPASYIKALSSYLINTVFVVSPSDEAIFKK